MTVKELKELLKGVDDNVKVLIPMSMEFDGAFYSPCTEESAVSKIGIDSDVDEDDIKEAELLGKAIPEEDALLLLPHGFSEEKDNKHGLN